ncbi:NAD(P)-binding protein [Xylariomycetidae sp. FL2044]|nr:NAD(P)-binding protein [Xylariomycetidae sp. FL2044]
MAGPSSKTSLNVGVIGYGLSAKVFHIPFITTRPNLNLHSILQRKPTETSSAPKDHPQLKHHTDLDQFLSDPDLDLVVITTPPPTHLPFATQALRAGKHVMVEKPFVATSAEAETLIGVARESRRQICVYQNRRWDADFLTVQDLVSNGVLGRVVEFETHFDRYRREKPSPETWKAGLKLAEGGSALYDLGSHLIDQVYVLFGMPRSVFGKLISQRDGAMIGSGPGNNNADLEPDSVALQLYYDDGLVAYVRIGVLSAEARQPRFWVRGEKGSYRKSGLDPQEPQLRSGSLKPGDAGFGREADASWDGQLVTVAEGKGKDGGDTMEEKRCPTVEPQTYGKIYELFAKAILDGGDEKKVPVPAAQARDVLRIIEATIESARTGREVVLSS